MSNTVADKLARKTRKKAPAKQVRLKLVYIDFWSAVKFSFMISLCWAIVSIVCTVLVYLVLLQTGVLEKLNEVFSDIVGGDMSLMSFLGFPQVLAFSVIVGVLNTIVGTVLGAIAALVYNLIVRVLGGFQLGFSSN
jgi:ABC-type spermidine/putrescine transport system permease subunit II